MEGMKRYPDGYFDLQEQAFQEYTAQIRLEI